ncbi:MAG TPA: DUF4440 domain-containing protein [Planctomycetaceae bacterium]|jgi:peroxiredoxin/ketosteroid isomerase-like protein|nr:DUF4440 domain-containing protein [Planctomycetaceae bacterium]
MMTSLRKRLGLLALASCAFVLSLAPAAGQSIRRPTARVTADGRAGSDLTSFTGKWSYRSFVSNPDLSVQPNELLFGSGTMDLAVTGTGVVSGTLGGPGWQLTLSGTATKDGPATIRFQGRGIVNNEQWVYDYLGFMIPMWPNGVDQRPAIVGSIVRTVAHTGGTAPAGEVAQWIAVKQDAANTGSAPANASRLNASSVETQLRDLETKWAAAVSTNDPAQIGVFFTDDFLFVGANGLLQNRQQHLDDFKSGALKIDSVKITDFTVHAYGTFAVVNVLTHVVGKHGTRDISGDYRFMDTWKYDGSQWLAVARQQTKVLPPPPASASRPRQGNAATPADRVSTVGGPDKALIELETLWARFAETNAADQIGGLLSNDFLFANADGVMITRTAYLDEFRAGRLRLERCELERPTGLTVGDTAVVSVTLAIIGQYNDRDVSAFYRTTDTFARRPEGWRAICRNQTKIASRKDPLFERIGRATGHPRVVIFVLGSFCPHCMTQLMAFAKELSQRRFDVSVVSADTEDDLRKFPKTPFKLVADPEHKLFRRFGAFNGKPIHATLAFDGRGEIVFSTFGERPFMQADVIAGWLDKASQAEASRSPGGLPP